MSDRPEGAVPFRFEIPARVAHDYEGFAPLRSAWVDDGGYYDIAQSVGSFSKDTIILEGHADRSILAKLGPLVEACWRPVSGDREGTSG